MDSHFPHSTSNRNCTFHLRLLLCLGGEIQKKATKNVRIKQLQLKIDQEREKHSIYPINVGRRLLLSIVHRAANVSPYLIGSVLFNG